MRRGIVIAILVMIFQLAYSQKCWSAYSAHSDIIEGVSRKDAQEAMKDIAIILHQKKFAKFRTLIALKDKRFIKIDPLAVTKSLEKEFLDRDDSSLVKIIVCSINSPHKYLIEFIDTAEQLSNDGAEKVKIAAISDSGRSFGTTIKEWLKRFPDSLKNRKVTKMDLYRYVVDRGGAITTKTPNGSYSLILNNHKETDVNGSDYFNINLDRKVLNPAGRPPITGHELFGHGLPFSLRNDYNGSANADAIRTENLILRVMGYRVVQRDGTFHGREPIKVVGFSELPDSCEEMIKQDSPRGMRD